MKVFEGVLSNLDPLEAVVRIDGAPGLAGLAKFDAYKHLETFREANVRPGDRVHVEHDGAYLRVRKLGHGSATALDPAQSPGKMIA
jgi:hypothetical protein